MDSILPTSNYTHSLVGTRNYIAPEVYIKDYKTCGYTKSCDMWSLGIISYFLLTGRNPLSSQFEQSSAEDIKKMKIPYPKRYWGTLSADAKDFVNSLLQFDPDQRLTASQAQKHTWFYNQALPLTSQVSPSLVENLQTFQSFNRLKKAAMTAVAYHLNVKELEQLEQAFEYFDVHNTGTISMEEFREAITRLSEFTKKNEKTQLSGEDKGIADVINELNQNEKLLLELFNGIDFNNTGCIDYPEFLAACLARKEGMKREYAELIFDLIDREHDGIIHTQDLHVFFGESIPIEEIESIIIKTFGEKKDILTESDLEKIMNTKMITNEATEEAAHHQTLIGAKPLATKTTINSLFDTFKMKSEDGRPQEDIMSTVVSTAKELNATSVGYDRVEGLATMRFTSLREE